MIVVVPAPLQVAAAQPVRQDQQLAARSRDGFGQGRALEFEGLAVLAQPHRDRQRIPGCGQEVADDPVQGSQHRLAFGRGPAARIRQRRQPRIDPASHHGGRGAGLAVGKTCDAACRAAQQAPGVYGLDNADHFFHCRQSKPAEAVQVGTVDVARRRVSLAILVARVRHRAAPWRRAASAPPPPGTGQRQPGRPCALPA